jgi:hypothetical protein
LVIVVVFVPILSMRGIALPGNMLAYVGMLWQAGCRGFQRSVNGLAWIVGNDFKGMWRCRGGHIVFTTVAGQGWLAGPKPSLDASRDVPRAGSTIKSLDTCKSPASDFDAGSHPQPTARI